MSIDLLNKHHVFIYKSKPENTHWHTLYQQWLLLQIQLFFSQNISKMQKENETTELVADNVLKCTKQESSFPPFIFV